MHEIAEFLQQHPPFDSLEPDQLEQLAASCEIEFAAAGSEILAQAVPTPGYAWVVRRGAVELVDGTRVVDLLGEGELFGHASLLSEWPTALAVRAVEDTLCYRIPAEAMRPVLARPQALRFAARSLAGRYEVRMRGLDPVATAAVDPARRPLSDLLRGRPVIASAETSVREAAGRMVAGGSSSLLVELDDGYGIVTDRDLRERVVAAGVPPQTPVRAVMTTPAVTIAAEATGADALLEMLDRGVRHLPVVDQNRHVIGVISDTDLLAAETRTPFHVRRAIARAETVDQVVAASQALPEMIVALHDAKVATASLSQVIATVHDALTRRLIELVEAEIPPPVPYTWLALGSTARRETFPSSDQDSAIAWEGETDDDQTRAGITAIAERVVAGLERCGIPACPNGAVASRRLFMRSTGRWRAVAQSWLDDPGQEKALILVSVLIDGRAVHPTGAGDPLSSVFAGAREHPALLRKLGLFALGHRPPTGFFRDFVLEHGGQRRGTLDIKRGGLAPVVDIARWAAMAAGVASASTSARLAAAGRAGTLPAETAATLAVAFELFSDLRMADQVEALRQGRQPGDHIDPRNLDKLTRRYLKDAFRAVADVQRALTNELGTAVV